MSRSMIQPLSCPDLSPSEHSLALMEKKLTTAEEETRHLLEEMSKTIGKGRPSITEVDLHGATEFSPLKYEEILESKCNVRPGQKNKDLHARITKQFSQNVKGHKSPTVNVHVRGDSSQVPSTKNYELLVSRMCRNESAIQTLKLNLLNLKGNYDLKKKQQAESEEKLIALREKYEEDTGRLERELVKTKLDLKLETDNTCSLESQIKNLTEQAEANSKAKVEADATVSGLGNTNDKLIRKIKSLTEDLAREISLRERLEHSHETLLARIRETEMMVETERTQMGGLSTNCESLKGEISKLKEELRAENETRQLTTKKCGLLENELAEKLEELESGKTEREKLRHEVGKLRSQYEGLISQLQSMENIMSQHQEVHTELQAKNQRLKEALDNADLELESLKQRHKTDIEMERAKGDDCIRLEEKARCLQATVKQLESENEQLVQNRERLENEALESSSLLKSREREFKQSVTALEGELNQLRAQLSDMEKDKLRANKDKEDLLHEVNSAVDGMSDERWRLRNELQDAKLEIKALTKASQDLESECANLHERNRALLSQESSRKQLDSTLKETADHKNRLAYDKGRLQSQVTKLQAEVNSLANTQIQLVQLQKHCDGLEAKYCKAQKDIGDYKLRVQRLENQVKQAGDSAQRQEADFNLAIKSRDEAVKENCQLLERLNTLEEHDTHKVISLERSLEEIRQDNFKLTQTLGTVMSAHSQLQTTVENLQTELGQRDAHIAQLTADKSQAKQKVRDLQSETEVLKQQIVSLETLESNELEPLRKALQRCRDDNGKMAASLEDVLDSNSELQTSVDRLQADVQKKDNLISKLKDEREKEQKRVENELRSYEERISNIGDQLKLERDKSTKKSNKDIYEMRKQNEGMVSKNGELSRTNTELRQKVSELETTVKELKHKLTNQKTQIEHMARAKKQMEEHFQHLKDVRGKLDDLEKVRDEYIEKNRQQGKSISDLLSQLGSLQTELRHLAHDQFTTRELVQRKDEELMRERKLREEMARKYMDSRKSREEIEKQKFEFEEKIRLANEESLEVSKNLEAAHDWFKTKFDSLQEELATSKQAQAELEQDNISQRVKLEEERQRAKETAERARHMIRSSRKTMSQLGDYTSLLEQHPKDQVASLHQQIGKEKVQKKTDLKSKNTSSKQLEALINKYTKK